MIAREISIISILSIYNIPGWNNIICHFRPEVKARHNFPKTSSLFCNPILQMRNSIKTSQVKIYPAIWPLQSIYPVPLLKPVSYIPLFWIVILISRHLRVIFMVFTFSEWTIITEMPREPPKFDRSEVFIAKLSICMSANKKSLKTKISSEY